MKISDQRRILFLTVGELAGKPADIQCALARVISRALACCLARPRASTIWRRWRAPPAGVRAETLQFRPDRRSPPRL